MSHARKQIRDALKTALTGLATTGARVYSSPVYPAGDGQVPGLSIRTPSDLLQENRGALDDRQTWELEIEIEARAKPGDGTDVDDQLDQIMLEVQTAIAGDPKLGNRVTGLECQVVEFDFGSLERPAGIATMTWTCRYQIQADHADTLIYYSAL